MDRAAHNNSSLLPILSAILFSFIEQPEVDVVPFVELILWAGRAPEPCISACNERFLSVLQIWTYFPGGAVRSYTEEAISSSFQFENLR